MSNNLFNELLMQWTVLMFSSEAWASYQIAGDFGYNLDRHGTSCNFLDELYCFAAKFPTSKTHAVQGRRTRRYFLLPPPPVVQPYVHMCVCAHMCVSNLHLMQLQICNIRFCAFIFVALGYSASLCHIGLG